MLPRPARIAIDRRCGLRSTLLLLLIGSIGPGARASELPFEEAVLAHAVDPNFLRYAHRQKALTDALGIIEAGLAASGGYRQETTATRILTGATGAGLQALAASRSAAGPIAAVMLTEAEHGYFGAPSKAVHHTLPAQPSGAIAVALQQRTVQRLRVDTPPRAARCSAHPARLPCDRYWRCQPSACTRRSGPGRQPHRRSASMARRSSSG